MYETGSVFGGFPETLPVFLQGKVESNYEKTETDAQSVLHSGSDIDFIFGCISAFGSVSDFFYAVEWILSGL